MTGYLPGIRTGILLGGRATYRDAMVGEGYDGRPSGYDDLLGVATTRVGRGRLRLISFSASNRLDFPSLSDAGLRSDEGDREEGLGTPAERDLLEEPQPGGDLEPDRCARHRARGRRVVGRELGRCDLALARRRGAAPKRARRVRCLGSRGVARAQRRDQCGGIARSAGYPVLRRAPPAGPGNLGGGLSLDAGPVLGSVFAERLWRPARGLLISLGNPCEHRISQAGSASSPGSRRCSHRPTGPGSELAWAAAIRSSNR